MSKPFDLLNVLAGFVNEERISLRDPKTVEKFSAHVNTALINALEDKRLLHGQRTEAMFRELILSLGQYKLLNAEDTGHIYPEGKFRAPDFRIVLENGAQWLIEVKNVYEVDPAKQNRRLMTGEYLKTLQDYASLTKGILKVAVYWARWGVWTLVSPEQFVDEDGSVQLDMTEAIVMNEMAMLGDRSIGTRPPLRLLITANPDEPNYLTDDGQISFTIGKASLYCGAAELMEPHEKEIAWILVQYGEWEEQEPIPTITGGKLETMEFSWKPTEQLNEGFEMIGTLSRIFSRAYTLATINEREIVQIEAKFRPGWFSNMASSQYESESLPLWRFAQQPKSVCTKSGSSED